MLDLKLFNIYYSRRCEINPLVQKYIVESDSKVSPEKLDLDRFFEYVIFELWKVRTHFE